jgi:hypothetical protein
MPLVIVELGLKLIAIKVNVQVHYWVSSFSIHCDAGFWQRLQEVALNRDIQIVSTLPLGNVKVKRLLGTTVVILIIPRDYVV